MERREARQSLHLQSTLVTPLYLPQTVLPFGQTQPSCATEAKRVNGLKEAQIPFGRISNSYSDYSCYNSSFSSSSPYYCNYPYPQQDNYFALSVLPYYSIPATYLFTLPTLPRTLTPTDKLHLAAVCALAPNLIEKVPLVARNLAHMPVGALLVDELRRV